MIVPVPAIVPPAATLGRVHFVGVGGAALSGLARLMTELGVVVTGSDAKDSPLLRSLRDLGVGVSVGHLPGHVDGADVVVVSTAIGDDNPEVLRARELGVPLWPRAAAVQSVILGRRAVVVTGTHGKTTTTAMLTTALLSAGADPSYAIGSTINASGLNAAIGSGAEFVVEGDESDAAILAYTPAAGVVTNIEADHLDFFGTEHAYIRVFDDFVDRIDPAGFLVCCVDDPGARRLAGVAESRGVEPVRAGIASNDTLDTLDTLDLAAAGVQFGAAVGGGSEYTVIGRQQRRLGTVRLAAPGRHYVLDSLTALAAGLRLGYSFDALATGLASYRGSGRRMERRGEAGGVTVYDSYAHHPTEIRGDLEAARALLGDGGGRLVVCFQPHLFSRTRLFGAEMGEALSAADEVVVMDVYPAREQPEPGIDGSIVAVAITLPPTHVLYEPDWQRVARSVVERTDAGDLVLTLGAGDVTEIGPLVLTLLAAELPRRDDDQGGTR
jgi:UDP-N-acetylmuramate--alanine ligase